MPFFVIVIYNLSFPTTNSLLVLIFIIQDFYAVLPTYLDYLEVSSPLQLLTSNDTPQALAGGLAGASSDWWAGLFLHISHPGVSWSTSRTLAYNLLLPDIFKMILLRFTWPK